MVTLAYLFDDEHENAMEWWWAHEKECDWASGKKYAGAMGGVQSWIITNTSIGQLVTIRCTCGASKLVSKYL